MINLGGNMKIYIVVDSVNSYIWGVFSTKEIAKEFVENEMKKKVIIQEFDVDYV